MTLRILILLTLIQSSLVWAQNPKFKEYKNKAAYPFLLYEPETKSPDSLPPIIIFLHGRSLSGTDLNMVKRYGLLDALKRGTNIPAIIIAPQVKKSESWNPDKVLNVLEFVQSKYAHDSTRIYVVGMSLGGYGTLHFAGKYPEKVAAAVAMCGGGNPKDACNLGQTNIWIQHGKKDHAVPFTQSLEIFDAISSCTPQGECVLTLYPNYGHGEMAREFYKDTIYNWLFQFQLGVKDSIIAEKEPVIEVVGVTDYPDSLIRIPEIVANKPSATQSSGKIHVVRQGDTLSKIAKKHNTSVAKLCKLNGLRETSVLQIGQKIKIP